MVVWSPSASISCFEVQSSIGHLVWFFDSGNSTVSGAKFWCPYKIGEFVPKLLLVLTFHQALCVLKSVLVHKRSSCIILVTIHLHIFELANPISGRSAEGNWVLFRRKCIFTSLKKVAKNGNEAIWLESIKSP